MSAFTPRHKDICTEFQRQTFEDHEAVTIDVKEGPVGSRHRAAVPATATKKAPNLCGARSWSHEENKPVLPMTRTSSRTMIHLATFTLASYSVASLDLKLRSVFEQLNFESAPHISCKKKIDSFSLFSLFTVRSAAVILFATRLFKRNESTSIISRRLRRSSCTKALNPGIARPTMVTWEFQASNFATAYFEKRWNKGWVGRVGMENLSLKIVWSDTLP